VPVTKRSFSPVPADPLLCLLFSCNYIVSGVKLGVVFVFIYLFLYFHTGAEGHYAGVLGLW